MKIALIQDEIYLPSLAGGTKANRCLLENLVKHGHECLALTRALTLSSDGPNNLKQFAGEMKVRNKIFHQTELNVFNYEHEGVQVDALDFAELDQRRDYLVRRIQAMNPDCIFVTDDKRRFMLQAAMEAFPSRVIMLLQTIIQLPFGPLAVKKSREYTELIKSAQGVVVISNFMKRYIQDYGDMESYLLPIPVYGKGPFPDLARFDQGFVTMINPCELKGVSIFIRLAREFPDIEFAAVPTWGSDQNLLNRLRELHNIQILKPADDIEEILGQTRILIVPSLWPETFGYVVPEAMLRGIPVLASDIGGLPEAKLGVDFVLPVIPGEFCKEGFVSPPQDLSPWSQALDELLSDEYAYQQCSKQSRQAAHDFVANVSVSRFEALMNQLVDIH
jgi:glycosyltransferase involved in cell wall biosynthesis